MKALSIRQPWANAIIYLGKDVENRSWPTRFRGPVLVHAAKNWGASERAQLGALRRIAGDFDWPETPLLGGIIGVVDVIDCVQQMDSPWFSGPYGFVLRNPRPLKFWPMPGALNFFNARHPSEPTPPPERN